MIEELDLEVSRSPSGEGLQVRVTIGDRTVAMLLLMGAHAWWTFTDADGHVWPREVEVFRA